PDRNVTITAYSYFEDEEGYWHRDDKATKNVSLVAPPEVYAGTISRMELEYDEARAAIPAYNIPQGQRGLVHIWGRNDMSTSQKLGISWRVKDPDGTVVEEYSDWQAFLTGPGEEHEFIGGRFDLDKVGTYTIFVGLVMNFDDPEYVDTYPGDLCAVAAEGVGMELKAGWNAVVYKGKAQLVEEAFASIMSYLDPESAVYYWDSLTGAYVIPVTDTFMVPYRAYWIKVTQDCTWTYGAEATAPSSVYLYAGWNNLVPWCGEAIPPAEAFAPILSYLST
ncbi:unnamed protein product, partial [marine sediment metagenome]